MDGPSVLPPSLSLTAPPTTLLITPIGEIEIELQWTDRLYEYDLELAQQKQVMARRIQCMGRKVH